MKRRLVRHLEIKLSNHFLSKQRDRDNKNSKGMEDIVGPHCWDTHPGRNKYFLILNEEQEIL
jgi:hypothetical protein